MRCDLPDLLESACPCRVQIFNPPLARDSWRQAFDALLRRRVQPRISLSTRQRQRNLIEQAFGWTKTVAIFRRLRHRGGCLVDCLFSFGAVVYQPSTGAISSRNGRDDRDRSISMLEMNASPSLNKAIAC